MRKIIFFSICLGLCVFNLKAQIAGSKVGLFNTLTDIGNPNIAGSASYHQPAQTYRVSGSGANIWFNNDSFSFLHREMNGDFIMQTRFQFIGKGNELHRKTGFMIRQSKAANSPAVVCTVHGDGLTSLQYRIKEGENMKEIKFKISAPDVLQLEKKGNSYIMSVSHFGEVYQTEKLDNIDLGVDLLAGLFVCSHNNKFSEEVEFSNTRVFYTKPDNLIQYKSYLGSALEVLDITTGHREVMSSSSAAWQAPNWTPDGKTLIYNLDGKLYNFDIATKESTLLNTEFADKNNNDHVLSMDGKQIGISHHPKEANGKSIMYTLPINGGVPKKITDKSPSYFHGWSPDDQSLLYTGERNGDFDIYKISKDGGTEIQLTKSKGLDDGSEYSPDGKYIYFCSTRTSTMQVWRMDADGKNQTQLTSDELNNWFPHVSPDNKWIVFMSFPKEVAANEHPYYERVYLRLMPITGGQPKVISYVYGGQGTLNVPSWSPDSKKIAFVSNGNFE